MGMIRERKGTKREVNSWGTEEERKKFNGRAERREVMEKRWEKA